MLCGFHSPLHPDSKLVHAPFTAADGPVGPGAVLQPILHGGQGQPVVDGELSLVYPALHSLLPSNRGPVLQQTVGDVDRHFDIPVTGGGGEEGGREEGGGEEGGGKREEGGGRREEGGGRREEGGGRREEEGGEGGGEEREGDYLLDHTVSYCGTSILVSHLQCLMSGGLLRLGFLKYSPLLIGLVTLLETRV